jgi:hypothetical protein
MGAPHCRKAVPSLGRLLISSIDKAAFAASTMGLGGLEPPTSPLSGVRSNQLSYKPGRMRQDTKAREAREGIWSTPGMTSPLFRRGAMRGLKKLSPPVGGVHQRGSARTPITNLCKEVIDVNDVISIGVTVAGRTKLAEHLEDVIDIDLAITVAVTLARGAWNAVDVD